MKKLLLGIIISLLTLSIGYSQEINLDNETKEISNQVIMNIYNDILGIKDKYKELEAFDDSVLGIGGKYDFNSIYYSHNLGELSKAEGESKFGDNAFNFSLSITSIGEEVWQAANSFVNLSYPNLGIKFYGFFVRPRNIRSDLIKVISDIVNKNAQLLKELDQKYPSFQITTKSDKEVYEVGEPINMEVFIKNLKDVRVSLDGNFDIGANLWIWGPLIGKEITLEPGQEMTLHYNLYDFKWKKQFSSIWPNQPLSDFMKAGKYPITLILQGKDSGRFSSDAVTIEVVEKKILIN